MPKAARRKDQAPARFVLSHAKEAKFRADGLRAFFAYRDLGMVAASKGKVVAHVIKARKGHGPAPEWHTHDLDFQMVYVLKGWVKFEYEGVGKVTLRKGSCVHQPPGIRHREIAHSADVEMLEIVSPAKFRTRPALAREIF
ncbi:MAG: cupin domain-containing protein [Proteobacteria bacterium]|nr:cupin domain-containing protein [Pseudomonadota bacterium]